MLEEVKKRLGRAEYDAMLDDVADILRESCDWGMNINEVEDCLLSYGVDLDDLMEIAEAASFRI